MANSQSQRFVGLSLMISDCLWLVFPLGVNVTSTISENHADDRFENLGGLLLLQLRWALAFGANVLMVELDPHIT